MMEIDQIRKVRNGWGAFNEYGDLVAVATTQDQIAELVGIDLNKHANIGMTKLLEVDINAFEDVIREIRHGQKIEAIKKFRYIFSTHDGELKVTLGLKTAKDMIEMIMEKMK